MTTKDRVLDRILRTYFIAFFLEWLLIIFSKFKPKSHQSILLFGAMNGRWYGDNAKHLYEHFLKHENKIRVFWVTKNSKIHSELISQNKPSLYQFSFRYLYYLSHTKIAVYTDSLRDMLINTFINPDLKLINLRHGRSIKRVRFARKNHKLSASEQKERLKESKLTLFATSTSKFISEIQEKCLEIGIEKHIVTGYPRNDSLILKKDINRESGKTKVLYAPTWRHGRTFTDFFPFKDFNLNAFNSVLKKNNIEMYLRPHVGEINNSVLSKADSLSNLIIYNHGIEPDINNSLHKFDALISDYSALIHDFLLLDRPIILIPYDYDSFKYENGFLYDFYDFAPGRIVLNADDMIESVSNLEKIKLETEPRRTKLKNLIHFYQDSSSCNRVSSEIKRILNV